MYCILEHLSTKLGDNFRDREFPHRREGSYSFHPTLCQTSMADQALQCHVMSCYVTLYLVMHSFDLTFCQTSMANQVLQCHVMSRHVTLHSAMYSFDPTLCQTFMTNWTKQSCCHVTSHSVLTSYYPPSFKSSNGNQTVMSHHVTPHLMLHSFDIHPLVNHPRQTKPSCPISCHVMSRLTRSCILLYPDPCQTSKANQTELCAELLNFVADNGDAKYCDRSFASCHVNNTNDLHDRTGDVWGNCYCDHLCKEIGDCCVDYDEW